MTYAPHGYTHIHGKVTSCKQTEFVNSSGYTFTRTRLHIQDRTGYFTRGWISGDWQIAAGAIIALDAFLMPDIMDETSASFIRASNINIIYDAGETW